MTEQDVCPEERRGWNSQDVANEGGGRGGGYKLIKDIFR